MNVRLVSSDSRDPERLNHLVEIGAQISGKLPLTRSDRLFFFSLSTQQLSKDLGGFAAPIDARVYHVLTRFTPFLRGTKQLDFLYAGNTFSNSREGAEAADRTERHQTR